MQLIYCESPCTNKGHYVLEYVHLEKMRGTSVCSVHTDMSVRNKKQYIDLENFKPIIFNCITIIMNWSVCHQLVYLSENEHYKTLETLQI